MYFGDLACVLAWKGRQMEPMNLWLYMITLVIFTPIMRRKKERGDKMEENRKDIKISERTEELVQKNAGT